MHDATKVANELLEWCDTIALHQATYESIHYYFRHWFQQMMMLHKNVPREIQEIQAGSDHDVDRLRFPIALSKQHWTTLRQFGIQHHALSLFDVNDAGVAKERISQRLCELWITSKLRSYAETRQRDHCITPLPPLVNTTPGIHLSTVLYAGQDKKINLVTSTKEYRLPGTRWKVDAHLLVQRGSYVIPFLFELKSAGDSGNVGKRIKEEQWRWSQILEAYREFVTDSWSVEPWGHSSLTLLSPIPCILFGGCISVGQVKDFQSIGYTFFWEHEGIQPILFFIQQQCNALYHDDYEDGSNVVVGTNEYPGSVGL